MDATELKALQEPLKTKYKAEPEAALITLKAKSQVGEGITCKIETGKSMAEAGLHPATGGDGLSVCSGDMLLEALAACAGVTLKAVATATGFNLQDASVHTEGDLDFRGTLSVDKTAPVGFKEIRMRFEIRTDEPEEKTTKLIQLTERFCVVYQTLVKANPIPVSVGLTK
ncbi:MAG TPA: OsmC family protein [Cyclobacteriaceae bacterium]|nr:OsmC family protein [Cyclobacteriaceae bacterium]